MWKPGSSWEMSPAEFPIFPPTRPASYTHIVFLTPAPSRFGLHSPQATECVTLGKTQTLWCPRAFLYPQSSTHAAGVQWSVLPTRGSPRARFGSPWIPSSWEKERW